MEAGARQGDPEYILELANLPTIPPLMVSIWRKFRELHRSRSGGFGPAPITDLGVQAWKENTGRRLDPWEWSVIQRIDDVWLAQMAKTAERDAKRPK